MRRVYAALVTAALAVAVVASPAAAITGNYQKDFIHPYVGLVVFYDESGEFLWRCSGTLLSPSIFLTAGHCTDEPAASAQIWFQQDAGARYDPALDIDPVSGYPYTGGYTGTPYDYGFDNFAGYPDTHDAGVVVLDQPIPRKVVSSYASLAAAGSIESIAEQYAKRTVTFTVSGYGLSQVSPVTLSFRERLMATVKLINFTSANTDGYNLQTSANPSQGKGGTCFGDSGGPVFWDATNVIVAVTSFGMNGQCKGVDFGYRTDQEAVLAWILAFAEAERETIRVVEL